MYIYIYIHISSDPRICLSISRATPASARSMTTAETAEVADATAVALLTVRCGRDGEQQREHA